MKKTLHEFAPEKLFFGMRSYRRTVFIILVLLFNVNAFSQEVAFADNIFQSTKQEEKLHLKNVLVNLEQKYGVRFIYQSDLVSEKFVNKKNLQTTDVLEQDLIKILKPLKLNFKKAEGSYFLIFSETQSLEKLNKKPVSNDISASQTDATDENRQTFKLDKLNKILRLLDIKDHVVKGKVTSQEDGFPLPGVNVILKGSSIGTTTDANGEYLLNVPGETGILVFSFIGFVVEEVAINSQSLVNLVMAPDVKQLSEVVVVGYGTQSRKNISGSVANVTAKSFNQGVTRDAVDLLQGKVSGLVITRPSGDVSAEQTIRLRGTSSLTGSSTPFIVIDGVPGMSLQSVAPQDIESISILKDASAGAIYGSRSASGVILITTKKGKLGKPVVEYEGYVALDRVSNKPDLLNAEQWRNYMRENNLDMSAFDKGANTDWFDQIMRTGVSYNHSLSLSGGTELSNYRATFSYLNREGVVSDNSLERLNGRLTFNQRALNDKLNLTFIGGLTQRDYRPTDTRNFVLAYNMLPVYPVKNPDGTWFESREYDQGNPVHNIELNNFLHKGSVYFVNTKADVEIIEGLNAGLSLFRQREADDYSEFLNSETEKGRNDNGFAKRENETKDKSLLETTINYQKAFEKHNIGLLTGYSYEENQRQKFRAQNRGFVSNLTGPNDLGAGQNLRTSGDLFSEKKMDKLISFFGRVNYTFNEKYILTAAIRRDGSSKFGENHKWGLFPSISTAWRISGEQFMSTIPVISDLKLRAGYGVAGNQADLDPYQSLEIYGASGQYYDDGKWYTAYEISQNANPDLKWEETAMLNIGLDFELFMGRVSGTVEYYDKETSDLLYKYKVPVPPYLKDEMIANVGTMTNKGIEVMLNGDVIRTSDWSWNLSVNLAHNKNEITKLSNENYTTQSIKTGDAWIRGGSSNTTHIVEEGKEVGTFYGWKFLGFDESGKYILDDLIDGEPGLSDKDRTYIGSAQPSLTYGISSTVSYKGWDLNFFLRGVSGNDLLNFSKMSYSTLQWLPGSNVLDEALSIPLRESPKYNSYYIEDGSFLRMDNATLGYRLTPKKLLGIERIRFYFTAQNLFIITKYTGLDPEIEMKGLDPGVEGREYYPKSKTYSVGVNLTF